MDKYVFLTTILVIFIVVDVSNAASLWRFRKLDAPSPKEDLNVTFSPVPSPSSNVKQDQVITSSTSGNDKSKDKQVTVVSPPMETKQENKTPKEVKEKDESKSKVPIGGTESCDGKVRVCRDTKSMIACIRSFDEVSKALAIVIQNEGDSSLKVDIKISSSQNKQNMIEIPELQTKMVNMSLTNGGSNEMTLNAGNGNCVLHLGGVPTSQGNFFRWLPSYSKFMTPVYGAYFVLATTLIAGSVWACCWFRKRKRSHTDIPYQELEMSMPESAVVVAHDTTEGWDEVWDDDWDEERAVKSSGEPNISANGLTSRTPTKDGWEDWDD